MNLDTFKDEVLKTLSFIDPLGLDQILLDLDRNFAHDNPDITYQDLLDTLQQLQRLKKVKLVLKDKQQLWVKVFPKRPWYKKWFGL